MRALSTRRRLALCAALGLAACGPPADAVQPAAAAPVAAAPPPVPAEAPPLGRLPTDVRPTHYKLALEIVPTREGFAGTVEIATTFDRPREVVWLHAKGLTTKTVTVRPEGAPPVAAKLTQVDKGGVAKLELARAIGPGRATIAVDFEAPFGAADEGLHRVERGGTHYAVTQLESIFARTAFPCFDEPAFKTPFDVALVVPKGDQAIFNTRMTERIDAASGLSRVTFATTPPLPTYLVAIGVGPYEVVDAPPIPPNAVRARPLPFRGVAVAGRGKDLAYTLAETPRILEALEVYTGIAYPWDKLDVIAVPGKLGAMENPGAVTFGEDLLLVDGKRPGFDQRVNFEGVMTHELSHQWFGDLVTMPWWDDTWLNESFATWLATRTGAELFPKDRFAESSVSDTVWAMGVDSLTSARRIHEPVTGNDGIMNAFDGITYTKGGAVLRMFERFVGRDAFQRGLRAYLAAHRFGSATERDLLAALSDAAKTDVATPFRTFLDQPGVPFVETKLVCDASGAKLKVAQSRYFPLGSSGQAAASWQIPLCVRLDSRETCGLVTTKEALFDLRTDGGHCPKWFHPNAHAAGYYRFAMAPDDARNLEAAFNQLDVPERVALGADLLAAFAAGRASGDEVVRWLPRLAHDPNPEVATLPHDFLSDVSRWYEGDAAHAKLDELAKKLYAPVLGALGWEAKSPDDEPAGKKALRANAIAMLALFAKDPAARKEAAKRGRAYLGPAGGPMHPVAADPAYADVAIACALDADPALFDVALAKLASVEDPAVRETVVKGMIRVKSPALANRARDLILDARIRLNEMRVMLVALFGDDDTRKGAWTWFQANVDKVFAKYPPARAGRVMALTAVFCDAERLDEMQRLFDPRAGAFEGATRRLAGAVESVRLCVAGRTAQQRSVTTALAAKPAR